MELFLIILLLLSIIGVSSILNHWLPFVPVPIIQIILGVVIALLPLNIHVSLETELFLVLFIAPLLFHDGRNVSRRELWNLRIPILSLALGLVFLTVLVIGHLIHLIVPLISLPAAFALAAILSPTDIVAVSAISSRVNIPQKLMHLLEGEGLMNDASGLVAFKFAVSAAVTGAFSLWHASVSFIVIALGGFLGGIILAILIIRLRVFIRRLGMEDVTIHMLIQILTPFFIYIAIEQMHCSGILAVVSAGIVHAIEKDRERTPKIGLQIVSKSTWTVVLYILNGLVFVLLGLQIPHVMNEIFSNPHFNNYVVVRYILMITIALIFLRFVWISTVWWIGWKLKIKRIATPTLKSVGILTISGIRGAITLAGAFSIPLSLANGMPFPGRELIIFIAAGVILFTLILATLLLPIMAKSEDYIEKKEIEKMEKRALIRMKEAAIRTLQELTNEENHLASLRLITTYSHEMNELKYGIPARESNEIKQKKNDLRLKALEAQSHFITSLFKSKKIDRETAYLIQLSIRRLEMAVTNRFRFQTLYLGTILKRIFYKLLLFFRFKKQKRFFNNQTKTNELKKKLAKVAIQALKDEVTPENKSIVFLIIGEFNKTLTKLNDSIPQSASTKKFRLERKLQDKAFQAERDECQSLYEKGSITLELLRKLRQQINIREAYWMDELNTPAT
ncbi:sodium/proton antiporter, CPA1 family [Seinonella peptonophila]|uniref:Sodium/proton antiporter, CPA1 family n=1 Tax=Seinonella peptonophila TaxID=112248 RepID=A0A1M4ZNY2_9BACL|nr:Na+/H+ antiporter [Seinonella peptonophila]SHF19743.1 sodium/proton antiporter, CPA1 family [Seinonella peptonophila]